jgi:hypothetical protein
MTGLFQFPHFKFTRSLFIYRQLFHNLRTAVPDHYEIDSVWTGSQIDRFFKSSLHFNVIKFSDTHS